MRHSSRSWRKSRAGYGVAAEQHVVERRAERVQIGARVERLQVHRLGRAERRRADQLPARAHRHHRAEVDQLGPAVAACSARCAGSRSRWTSRRECSSASTEHTSRASAQAARHGDRRELVQVAAVEQLHRVVRADLVDAVVVDLDDARMGELRERVELALEQRDRAFRASLSERRRACSRLSASARPLASSTAW